MSLEVLVTRSMNAATVTTGFLADDAVTTVKILDANVTAGKLASSLDLTGKTVTVATASAGDNDTSVASTAFVRQEITSLVDSAPAAMDTLNELAAALGDDANFSTTVNASIAAKLPLAGGTMTGNISLGDNNKAIFGTGNDLQLYHDGTHSYLLESNAIGNLYLGGDNLFLTNANVTKVYVKGIDGGATELRHNNVAKLATTSTGIDVTGTVTADNAVFGTTSDAATIVYITSSTTGESELRMGDTDTDAGSISYTNSNDTLTFRAAAANRMSLNSSGLDVTGTATATSLSAGSATFEAAAVNINILETNTTDVNTRLRLNSGDFIIQTLNDAQNTVTSRLAVDNATGDISFYEDTGSTAKFFWDASAESLGIGTSSPDCKLHTLESTNNSGSTGLANGGLQIENTNTTSGSWSQLHLRSTSYDAHLRLLNDGTLKIMTENNTSAMTILDGGNVGIGTSSPAIELDVYGDGSGVAVGRPWGNDAYVSSGYFGKLANTAAGGGWAAGSAFMKIEDSLTEGVRKGTNIDFVTHNYGSGNQTTMTLSAEGNVGIGTTSPSTPLHVYSNTSGVIATISGPNSYNSETGISLAVDRAKISGVLNGSGGTPGASLRFYTQPDSGSLTERMRIDSSGRLLLNTTAVSAEAALNIGKVAAAGNQEGGQLVLQSSVNGSKAIHIDNYNNASVDYCRFMRGSDTGSEAVLGVWDITNTRFGIGTATPLQTLTVAGSAWATGYYITALQGNSQLTNASTSSGSNPSYIGQGLISVTVSDAKAKENFGSVETNECLNKIVSLSEHVKKFDWIDEDWKKQKGRTVGMVAQEIYEDHSEFVNRPENYDDDGWAIRYQEIVPTLVKAIQEQQTIIDDLKSRIDEAGL